MVEKKRNLILNDKNIYKGLLVLALPIFLNNLLISLHDIVDMYFISPIGESALAAISITGPVIMICQALTIGFMIAGSSLISQYLGSNQAHHAKKVTGQLFLVCSIVGIIFNILLYFLTPKIIMKMGATGETLEYATSYLRIRSFELFPIFSFFAFHASRQASGDTTKPFYLTCVGIVSNLFLTWYFINKLQLGIKGAALSTVLSQVLIVPIFLKMLFSKNSKYISIDLTDLRFNFEDSKLIFLLGAPAAISQALTAFGFLILNTYILMYGEATVSAFMVGNRINSLVMMPALGVGAILATFVGQNIGANNSLRAKECVKKAMILTVFLMIIGGSILFPFRKQAAAIFLDQDSQAYKLCVEYMFFVIATLPLMGIYQVLIGTFQGAGETIFSLIMAVSRLWLFRVPLVRIFIRYGLPQSSIWYAMLISNFGAILIGILFYYLTKFKPKIKKKESDIDEELVFVK